MNLINKILFESEENELFKPRRIEGRKDEEKEKILKLIEKYPNLKNLYQVNIILGDYIFDAFCFVLAKDGKEALELAKPVVRNEAIEAGYDSKISGSSIEKVIPNMELIKWTFKVLEEDNMLDFLTDENGDKVYLYSSSD